MGADLPPGHGGGGRVISRCPEAHSLGSFLAGFWLIDRNVNRPYGRVLTSIRDTNEYADDGLRADGERVVGRLLGMVRGRA